MSRKQLTVVLIAVFSALGFAQTGADFDRSKAERELEIMSGILDTTLKFVSEQGSEEGHTGHLPSVWGSRSVTPYYFYDQGAVFMISLPSIRSAGDFVLAAQAGEIAVGEAYVAARQAAESAESRSRGSSRASSKRNLEALQEEVKNRQVELEKAHEEAEAKASEARDLLVEALANHGDSLTVLGPDEYINLVLKSNSSGLMYFSGVTVVRPRRGRSSAGSHEVLSVRKSWISDYKAGRITLDDFKAKVVKY